MYVIKLWLLKKKNMENALYNVWEWELTLGDQSNDICN